MRGHAHHPELLERQVALKCIKEINCITFAIYLHCNSKREMVKTLKLRSYKHVCSGVNLTEFSGTCFLTSMLNNIAAIVKTLAKYERTVWHRVLHSSPPPPPPNPLYPISHPVTIFSDIIISVF